MNLPIKIYNKKPWISINRFKNLLIDKISFGNYEVSPENSGPEGYIGWPHIENILSVLVSFYPQSIHLYRNSLEVYFHNLNKLIDSSLDFLYSTNPVFKEEVLEVDILLENSINKLSKDTSDLWSDPLIKETLVGDISSSFLGYTLLYDPYTENTSGKVLFRYLPEGSLREVILPLKVTTQPEVVDVSHPDNTSWGDVFTNDCKGSLTKEWEVTYDWKEPSYQRELYRSIMSKKGGLTIDDFYVKSFMYSKNTGRLNSKEIESSPEFNTIPENYLSRYSANIINCLSNNIYNQTTVNPGFKKGTSGWNIISKYTNSGKLDHKAHSDDITIEDTNEEINDPEIRLDGNYIKIYQTNRVPEGKYSLEISLKSNLVRQAKVFLGNTSIEIEIPESENLKLIKLTDVLNEGILVDYNDGIIDYGIEIFESANPSILFLEYCRLKRL